MHHVNLPKFTEEAHNLLLKYAKELTMKSLDKSLPKEIENSILSGKPGPWEIDKVIINLARDDFRPNPYLGRGHRLTFTIH